MINVFYHGLGNGPGKVVSNLISGFNKLNLDFKTNQQITPEDKLLVLQNHQLLSIKTENEKIIGPNICTLPIDNNEVMSMDYKKIIVPSQWVKDLYLKWLPEDKICIWAVGIDTDLFYDTSNEKKEIDCLIYFKRREESELNSVIKLLETNNQSYEIIRYGSYDEESFIDTIKKSRYGIVIDKCESQGIAIEEMMSANLPLLIWDNIIWDDRGEEFSVPATSVPYWDDTCGIKADTLEELVDKFETFITTLEKFKPRNYILNNLSLDKSVEKLLKYYG